jgi:hypothetical protein
VNFALSVYDVFAYAIPGAQYVGVAAYVLLRTGWVRPDDAGISGTALLLIAILASYLLGHATYPLHHLTDRLVPRWRRTEDDARREFAETMPDAAGRPFLTVPRAVLFTAIETRSPEPAVDIKRLAAMSLMCRGSVTPLLLAAAIGLVEIGLGTNPVLGVLAALVFGALAFGALRHGQQAAHWGTKKCLEVAYWMPDTEVRRSPDPPQEPTA